jgi:arylsulfatase
MTNRIAFSSFVVLTILAIALSSATAVAANQIVHDAEYYVLEAQHGEKWSADDNKIDKKLAEVRKKNGNISIGNGSKYNHIKNMQSSI